MESVIFAIVQLCTLAVMLIYGKKLSIANSNKQYWKTAVIPLLTYGFAYGLRFGRLVDWNPYYLRYVRLGNNMNLEDYEWVFEHICHYLYQLGIPYFGFIFLQCLFFMFSILLLFSINKDIVKWGLPVAFIFGAGNEMFIRFYMGFSFSIIAIFFLLRKDISYKQRYFWSICFAFLGGQTHSACYFILPIILTSRLLDIKMISWQVSIPILFLTTFVFNISQFTFLTDIANQVTVLSGGSDFQGSGYLDHVDELIAGDFMSVGYMTSSFQTKIRTFCYIAPAFYYSSKLIRKDSLDVFLYNIFVIGAILDPCFGTVELLNRFSRAMAFLGCIPCALWYVNAFKKNKRNSREFYLALISVFFLLYPYLNDAFLRPESKGLLFIWDANGRNYLPF